MAVYNFTSAKHIIAKVMRDTPFGVDSWSNDALTWIGEAIQAIGVYNGLVTETVTLDVKAHRAKLPCYTEAIMQVCYNGMELPYGSAHIDANRQRKSNTTTFNRPIGVANPGAKNSDYSDSFTIYTEGYGVRHNHYIINGGWINTTFEEGTIELDYQTIKTDDEGFPMIPDNYAYKEAIVWYIQKKLYWRQGQLQMADRCEAQWLTYCRQAANDCMFPSVDQFERLVDMFVNLMPATNFSNVHDYDYRRYSH